jgi:hypothetical protein
MDTQTEETYPTAREATKLSKTSADSYKYDNALSERLDMHTEYAADEHGEQDMPHGYYILFHIGESRAALLRYDYLGFVYLEEYGKLAAVSRSYREAEDEYNESYADEENDEENDEEGEAI